jgi:hypothetical protein
VSLSCSSLNLTLRWTFRERILVPCTHSPPMSPHHASRDIAQGKHPDILWSPFTSQLRTKPNFSPQWICELLSSLLIPQFHFDSLFPKLLRLSLQQGLSLLI